MDAQRAKIQSWLQNSRRTRSLSPSAKRRAWNPTELKGKGFCQLVTPPGKRILNHGETRHQARGGGSVTYTVVKDPPRSVRFCPEVQFFQYPLVGLTKVRPQRLLLNDNKASQGRLTSPTRASPRASAQTNVPHMDRLYGPNPTQRIGFRL
jgi:hypothetical protein